MYRVYTSKITIVHQTSIIISQIHLTNPHTTHIAAVTAQVRPEQRLLIVAIVDVAVGAGREAAGADQIVLPQVQIGVALIGSAPYLFQRVGAAAEQERGARHLVRLAVGVDEGQQLLEPCIYEGPGVDARLRTLGVDELVAEEDGQAFGPRVECVRHMRALWCVVGATVLLLLLLLIARSS